MFVTPFDYFNFFNKSAHTKKILVTTAIACSLAVTGCASKPKTNTKNRQKTTIVNYNGIPSRYQVKSGDTVSKIAARYGLNWREISALNRLDGNHTIHVGQWLTLHNHTAGNNNANGTRQTITRTNSQTLGALPTSTPNYNQTSYNSNTYNQSSNNQNNYNQNIYNPNAPLPTATITARPVSVAGDLLSFAYPVGKGNAVARRFGTPTTAGTTEGIFFSGKEGDAIMSAGIGTVIHADSHVATRDRPMVMISHDNGYVSSYFDVKNIQVKTGQQVGMGQMLGTMTAQTASGIALFEFRMAKNGSYIDPVSVLH